MAFSAYSKYNNDNLENEACNIGSPETLVRPLHTAFGVFRFPAVKGLGLEGFRREVRGSGPGLRLEQPHRLPKLDKKVELVVLPGERCRVRANKGPTLTWEFPKIGYSTRNSRILIIRTPE